MAKKKSGGKEPTDNGNGDENADYADGGVKGVSRARTKRPPDFSAPTGDSERRTTILGADLSEQLGGSYPVDGEHTTSDYASLPREAERSKPTQALVSARTGIRRGPRPPVRVRIVR